jgi:HAD superfamily hydrolase (TIGR01509 family)
VVTALLRRPALEEDFDAIATGAEVERGKPDPAIYRLAAKRLSLRPVDCVAVEDSLAG